MDSSRRIQHQRHPDLNYKPGITTDKYNRIGTTADDYNSEYRELNIKQYDINEQIKGYLKADDTFKLTVNKVLSMVSKSLDLIESSKIE